MREAKRTGKTGGAGWREFAQLAAVVMAVGLLTGLSPACSGGDDGGGGTSTTPCVQFEGSAVPGAITVIAVDGEPDDDQCDFLFVDLMVHDVDDLFAAIAVGADDHGAARHSKQLIVGAYEDLHTFRTFGQRQQFKHCFLGFKGFKQRSDLFKVGGGANVFK